MEKKYFIQKYVVEDKSYAEIAKELGWNKTSVQYYINKYNIQKQDPKKRQKEKTLRGKNHPQWGKRGSESHNFGRKHSKETIEKIKKSNTGIRKPITEAHREKLIEAAKKRKRKPDFLRKTPLYRAVRVLPEYRQWRTAVFKKDEYVCQKCKQKGGILNADHIVPLSLILKEQKIHTVSAALKCEELWKIENGRTLCVECHKQTKTYGGNIKGKYE